MAFLGLVEVINRLLDLEALFKARFEYEKQWAFEWISCWDSFEEYEEYIYCQNCFEDHLLRASEIFNLQVE